MPNIKMRIYNTLAVSQVVGEHLLSIKIFVSCNSKELILYEGRVKGHSHSPGWFSLTQTRPVEGLLQICYSLLSQLFHPSVHSPASVRGFLLAYYVSIISLPSLAVHHFMEGMFHRK